MRLWYLSHRRPAKIQASLRIRAVLPEPSLFAHLKYGSHTYHKLWTEICEVRQVFKRDYSSTLSTAQLQLGGSKHLSRPVNLRLSVGFFMFASMFILGKVKHRFDKILRDFYKNHFGAPPK